MPCILSKVFGTLVFQKCVNDVLARDKRHAHGCRVSSGRDGHSLCSLLQSLAFFCILFAVPFAVSLQSLTGRISSLARDWSECILLLPWHTQRMRLPISPLEACLHLPCPRPLRGPCLPRAPLGRLSGHWAYPGSASGRFSSGGLGVKVPSPAGFFCSKTTRLWRIRGGLESARRFETAGGGKVRPWF